MMKPANQTTTPANPTLQSGGESTKTINDLLGIGGVHLNGHSANGNGTPAPVKKPRGKALDIDAWLSTYKIAASKQPWKNGQIWRLDQCPFSENHTTGAYVVQLPSGAISAGCQHCAGKTWKDLRGIFEEPQSEIWMGALRRLGHTFRLNRLEDMIEVDGKRLDDITRSLITMDMASYGVPVGMIDHCINVIASEDSYHPVQDYLNGLVWDGQNHLSKMLQHITGDARNITYSNGNEYPLSSALIERWLLGCVARGLDGDKEQAFKHQTPMLVIIGKQGLGKSSWVRWLCSGLGFEYHRETPLNPHAPDDIRSAVTKWIWEVDELGSSLRRGDRDALKGFITQEWHTYRKPWGRANITKPTLCNLVGSLNPETGFLDDPTGHRRFLPVHITAINRKYAEQVDVNQLWAQLVHLYKTGTSPELSPLEKTAIQATYEEHEVENPLQTYMRMYFTVEPGNGELKCFTAEIMQRLQAFGINVSNNPKAAGREINDILAPMGLTRKSLSIGGGKGWGWVGIAPNSVQPPKRHGDIVLAVPSTVTSTRI